MSNLPDTAPKASILVVDDTPDNLLLIGSLLKELYTVRVANDGDKALRIAGGDHPPDLILLDIMMPVMDGYEVCRRLKAAPATRHIPVIFLTVMAAEENEEAGLKLGAVDYIAKPISPPILLARIDTQLRLKASADFLRDQNAFLEAEVARREAILHAVTHAASDAIAMTDQQERIIFWNPAAEKMFGYAANEVLHQPVPAPLELLIADADEDKGSTLEGVARRRDGGEFPVEISRSALPREGGRWTVAIVRDITERKALAERMAEAQRKLLQADKLAAIGQLAAGVVHEINTPLGFVGSNLGTLEEYVADFLAVLDAYEAAAGAAATETSALSAARTMKNERQIKQLRADVGNLFAESRDGLRRVRDIVKDLKNFSRAEEATWQWADLHEGLESTLNMVRNELKYHCTIHKKYGDLPKIKCLPTQLNQVFMNLLVNAGQAIAGRGDITLSSGRRGDEVFVAVSDTGSGISPENRQRLFKAFFTTKPVGQGTGLGLSLSHGIVQKHHGRIEVDSEPERGSTFTVWLPIDPERVDRTPA